MNPTAAKEFLDSQGKFCVARAQSATGDELLKYAILADLYLVLASTIHILTTGQGAESHAQSIAEALERLDRAEVKPHSFQSRD